MISVTHFADPAADFRERAEQALVALAARPGYVRGTLGRSIDSDSDSADWVLLTEWENVGSYRRALGNYEVKINAAPLLGEAADGPSAFESLIEIDSTGILASRPSDRA